MQKKADITFENNQFYVSGDLTFYNVMSIYEKSLPYLLSSAELHFDFSKVNSNDSSALALMMEWFKFAKTHHKQIQFSNFSPELKSIAQVSGLSEIIS